MGLSKEMENLIGEMVHPMMENYMKINYKVKDFIFGQIKDNILDNG
jgi:hypothetical protein